MVFVTLSSCPDKFLIADACPEPHPVQVSATSPQRDPNKIFFINIFLLFLFSVSRIRKNIHMFKYLNRWQKSSGRIKAYG